jgi:excinuclease ABC subunit A
MLQLQQWRENGFYSDEQIKDLIIQIFRKTHQYTSACFEPERDIMQNFSTNCQTRFLKVRVNGDVLDITLGMKLDRYTT